jgi:aminocarboxymuconate-semialdehyde decarboxylase
VIVDVHGHVAYPELAQRYPIPPALLDIEAMIEEKAAAGVDLTIVGSPTGAETFLAVPGVDPYAQPLEDLRRHHAWLGELVAAHPGRLAAYAFADPFGSAEMLAAVAEDVRGAGFVGIITTSSVNGRYLDGPEADDFFAMAAELDVPVLLHPPVHPVGAQSVGDGRLVEQVARYLDVTMSLATIVFGGRLEQHPDLKLIGATAGGAIALVAGRLDTAFRTRGGGPPWMRFEDKITVAPSEQLRRLYADTANLDAPNQLANLELLGSDRLLYGSDSPPSATPVAESIAFVRGLPISDEARGAILGDNARRLFGLVDSDGPPG